MNCKVVKYIKYLLKRNTIYQIHSPFVYNFVAYCNDLRKNKIFLKAFKAYKDELTLVVNKEKLNSKNAYFLYKIVGYFKPKSILVLGNSVRLPTFCVSNKKSKVIVLEKEESTGLTTLKNDNFTNQLKNKMFDLVYCDKVISTIFFEEILVAIHNNSIFIIKEIYANQEKMKFWKTIKNHKRVTLTIDVFNFGIVFFRKEQYEKEHFVLKIK